MTTNPISTLIEQSNTQFGELNPTQKRLFELAQDHFQELNASEDKLFRAISIGDPIIYEPCKDRSLRSAVIRWLCIEPEVCKNLLPLGIDISLAIITGSLDLSFSDISIPLRFSQCCFEKALRLQQAKLRRLDLSGSDIYTSEIKLFSNQDKIPTSIFAEGINVAGSILLNDNFCANGTVNLIGATIGGDLECVGDCKFISQNGYALIAQGINVNGFVFLCDGFKSNGNVSFVGANIGEDLTFRRATFTSQNEAINIKRINVKGSIYFVGTEDKHFLANGKVILSSASIGRNFHCQNIIFNNQNGDALDAQGIKVAGSIYFSENNTVFTAKGKVSLSGANIGGDLYCQNATFDNQTGDALDAQGVSVTGSIYFGKNNTVFTAKGKVSLVGAKIGNTLKIINVDNNIDLDLQFVKVQTLEYHDRCLPESETLKLQLNGLVYEALGNDTLIDSKQQLKWLKLQSKDNFSSQSYEQLAKVVQAAGKNNDAISILIAKENKLLTLFNWDEDNTGINNSLKPILWIWKIILAKTIDFGYRPQKAILGAILFILIGTGLFQLGYNCGLIIPTASGCSKKILMSSDPDNCSEIPNYQKFNALIYSTDVFLPIIDFRLEKEWIPSAKKSGGFNLCFITLGQLLLWYFWLHIFMGWMLTSLWVAAFTGLVRKPSK
jgi:hypothetical protein